MTYIRENNINYWPTPAESPDLNTIEMMWAELKNYIRKTVKPSKKEELIKGIKDFWQTVSVAKCNKYVDHIFKVLPINCWKRRPHVRSLNFISFIKFLKYNKINTFSNENFEKTYVPAFSFFCYEKPISLENIFFKGKF